MLKINAVYSLESTSTVSEVLSEQVPVLHFYQNGTKHFQKGYSNEISCMKVGTDAHNIIDRP